MNRLDKLEVELKTGREELTNKGNSLAFSLIDFWRWSVSDLLSNATRGRFAEFIVATAVNIDLQKPRNEWDTFDLVTDDGIKIEVKSAAYIQTWYQRTLSKISFNIKPAFLWDENTNKWGNVPTRSADIYVFCLLHHDVKQTCDPLNMDHWEFYVLATSQISSHKSGQRSLSLKSLQKNISAVGYDELDVTIRKKYSENK